MMKNNKKILIGIGILAVVFVLVIAYWQFIYCENKFHTLANEELKNYKYCASDSDCRIVGCGQCVNLEGASKYDNLKSFCFGEPRWKCLIPEGCGCVNNACIKLYSDNQTKKPTSSFGDDQLEKFITDYLLTQKSFSWKTITDSRNFCVIENLNPEKDLLFPLYVWVRCGEFILQNGELQELSGSSGPAKIDYPNQLSYRDISAMSHEAPRDGSLYSKDIKTIFPLDVQQEIIFGFNIANLDKKIETTALSGLGE